MADNPEGNMEKKVLIITYYWPPSGGSGVQRWLKFVKYLPQFGWEPYIFTPENPSFAIRDESLLADIPPSAEVLKLPIWEPYDIFDRISSIAGSKSTEVKPTTMVGGQGSFFRKVSTWIRGNFFIPDPRRFWVKPSVRFLTEFVRDNRIGTVITTGPPHSMHLIGYRLKKNLPSVRWIADFRDPWSEWGLLDSLRTGHMAKRLHRRLESRVLKSADHLITITPFYQKQFAKLAGGRVHLITNGYDEDDTKSIPYTRPKHFIIRHVGIVNERCDPRPFMSVLKRLAGTDAEFGRQVRMEFIGEVHPVFRGEVERDPVLSRFTVFTGNVPFTELMRRYGDSSLLLIVLYGYKDAEGYMPGKLFEYLATGIPVLGVGPAEGDAAALLKETGAGEMIEAGDDGAIERSLISAFGLWKQGLGRKALSAAVNKYSRRELTASLVELLRVDTSK